MLNAVIVGELHDARHVSLLPVGHTVPSIETLEKWARALDMPLYKVMYDGTEPPKPLKLVRESGSDKGLWGNSRGEARKLNELRRCLAKLDTKQRTFVLGFAGRLARSAAK